MTARVCAPRTAGNRRCGNWQLRAFTKVSKWTNRFSCQPGVAFEENHAGLRRASTLAGGTFVNPAAGGGPATLHISGSL